MKTIVNVVGARPNFMKIAPIMREMKCCASIRPVLVHTGQHYDQKMSQVFFDDLGMPRPDVNLEVGSASHAVQTAEIMIRFEKVLLEFQPHIVTVVGDVNSTIACALTAVKMGIAVAHVEAGLRSFDRTMPEEINRVLTDSISDYLFVPEPIGLKNLKNEGVHEDKVFLVGNVMVDSLFYYKEKARKSGILDRLHLDSRKYAVLTLHRAANVDDAATLNNILAAVTELQEHMPILFPVHPRTRARIQSFGFERQVKAASRLLVIEPLGYLDFLKIMDNARMILTDSGGIQEESVALGVPCITLRENTEWPLTVELGFNVLVGTDRQKIVSEFLRAMTRDRFSEKPPQLWDGKAALRISDILNSV